MSIQRFIINKTDKNLSLIIAQTEAASETFVLPFEYLRISSPVSSTGKKQAVVSHKKQVQLLAIESVAKHGYRFLFDDQHSAIYSTDFLQKLIIEQEVRWQDYLSELKDSGHSREAMITIKQV